MRCEYCHSTRFEKSDAKGKELYNTKYNERDTSVYRCCDCGRALLSTIGKTSKPITESTRLKVNSHGWYL